MSKMTTPTEGQPWVYPIALSTNTHAVVFNTENKFLDRNIKAEISVNEGSVSPLFNNTNIGTYFSAGTSSSNSISITPKATTTNGYIATYDDDHAVTGDTEYYTIKTTSLSFTGGALNGKTASADKANITWNTNINNGIYVQTKGTAGRDAVTYTNTNAGWLTAHTSATNASSKISASTWNGTTYYITAINVPKDVPFEIETTADTALDEDSDLTITNNAFRRTIITNVGNIYARHTTSGSGNVYARAYNETTDIQIIKNGAWMTPIVSAPGTYHGRVIVGEANPIFDGGTLSGTATASGSSTASISDTTNNSGISFTTACTATRANVLYKGAVSGWVNRDDDTIALSGASTSLTGKTYYINSVTVPKDKKFTVTTTADTALDTTSILTITNNAFRNTTITNAGTVYARQTTSGKGDVHVRSYGSSTDIQVIKNGAMITTSINQEKVTTVSGTTADRADASWETGWINSGNINAATFANTATTDVTYVDISNTTAAPVLTSGDFLYINRGYVDNLKISLAKLVPNSITGKTMAPANYILTGYAAFDGNGTAINGTMQIYDGTYTVTQG